MPGKRHFFIVTPFGSKSGDAKERATFDLVEGLKTNIIDAAIKYCEEKAGFAIDAKDGRSEATGDHIWEKIAARISSAAGVIGVICTEMPNTYIELGLAYAMWRRPILLRLNEQNLPSDLAGLERRDFTRAQALGQEDATDIIEWLAKRMLQAPARSSFAAPAYLPKTTASDGQIRTYNRFSGAIKFAEWSNALWRAEREIILAGPKLWKIWSNKWYSRPGDDTPDTHLDMDQKEISLTELLTERVSVDCIDLTVLLPEIERLEEADLRRPVQFEGLEENIETLSRSRKRWYTFRLGIEQKRQERGMSDHQPGRVKIISMHNTRFPYRLTMTDKRMFLTMRFHSDSVNTGFSIDATPASAVSPEEPPIFHVVRKEIDLIVEESRERSDAAYETWLAGQA